MRDSSDGEELDVIDEVSGAANAASGSAASPDPFLAPVLDRNLAAPVLAIAPAGAVVENVVHSWHAAGRRAGGR